MKRPVMFLMFIISTFIFAQQSHFRFANLTVPDKEHIESRPEFDFNADELKDLPVTDLLSIYVEEHLKVENVNGKGKMTTLLSLEIDDQGILKNVSSMGPNETFNREATSVFKKFVGKEMNIRQLKNFQTEILIPISVIL